ncbi:MAG TPA: hypothetical protein VF707_20850, partial [Ardenticatenaceae bacterium]
MVLLNLGAKVRLFVVLVAVGLFLFAYTDVARPLASSMRWQSREATVSESSAAATATAASASEEMRVTSSGSFPSAPVVVNSAPATAPERPLIPFIEEPAPSRVIVVEDLVREYGTEVFASVDAMPREVRLYYLMVAQQVADFFRVRPEDMLALVQEADPDGGLRLLPPASDESGARGVAQATARAWNGWANPEVAEHSTDQRVIDRYGGVGFDWAMRETWLAWREGQNNGNELRQADPNPDLFENSLAGAARYLVQWGLTRERAAADSAAFERRLADALSVYAGGQPLSETEYARYLADRGLTPAQGTTVEETASASLGAPVAVPELRAAYWSLMDRTFGVALGEEELAALVDRSPIAGQVASGALGAQDGAQQLLQETTARYLAEGQAALDGGQAMRWPFVHDQLTLAAQRLAVEHTGHTLTPWELDELIKESRGNEGVIAQTLSTRGDARLFTATRQFLDTGLKRSERGLPVTTQEVNA